MEEQNSRENQHNADIKKSTDNNDFQNNVSNASYSAATDSPKEWNGNCVDLHEVKPAFSNSFEEDKNVIKPIESELEQMNIVECLLDLDDYLEKMGEDFLKLDNSTVNSQKRSKTTTKSSYSSNAMEPFDRCSKSRKTTSCISGTQRNAPECKTAFFQRTWNNQMAKKFYTQNENQPINSVFNVKAENFETAELSENPIAGKFSSQVLTNEAIFQRLVEQKLNIENDRPRQLGRRAERFSTFAPHLRDSTPILTYMNFDNPIPTNATNTISTPENFCNQNEPYNGSDESTTRTSRNTTPASVESSTDSGESLPASDNLDFENNNGNGDGNQSINRGFTFPALKFGFNSYWPHDCSRTFALMSCTLGLFNASRFASLAITYGGNFLIQFLILSLIFGIPFLWLQMSLGAKIKAGPVSMWKISPICIGIGIAITVVQFFIAIYSTVAMVWILKMMQDIFIYKSLACTETALYTEDRESSYSIFNLTDNIPFYFSINVLERKNLLKLNVKHGNGLHINYRLPLYLAFVWATVFLILCKGLKSFGKCIFFLGVLPIVFLAVTAVKLLSVVDIAKLKNIFGSSEYDDFLVSSKTWAAAAQETFLTWGLFGASVLAVSSRAYTNPSKSALRRDAILVVLVTIVALCLCALVGLCSVQIINDFELIYVPGSYESLEQSRAIFSLRHLSTENPSSYPIKLIPHYSTLVGEIYRRHNDHNVKSGYQVLRFITELLPAALSVFNKEISWIWTLILFSAFFLFGLSQLCVIWKPISCTLGNSSTAVLISCVTGLLLGMPFATEIGISLLHYMDMVFGGAWFTPLLWSAEILGIFLIRGRPYNGDDLVNDLKMTSSMSSFLALSWNVLLPIGLITLAIIEYKISYSNEFYHGSSKSYFNFWSKKLGAVAQIGLLTLVPISATVQAYRYLTSGPPDILDRIQMLYRPFEQGDDNGNLRSNRNSSSQNNGNNSSCPVQRPQNDDPPKYTPPPSYSTATGAKLSKLLRQSFRRSVRRILGESAITRGELLVPQEFRAVQLSRPINNTIEIVGESTSNMSQSLEFENRPCIYGRSLSLGRNHIFNKRHLNETVEVPLTEQAFIKNNRRASYKMGNRPFSAEDVKSILGSSTVGRRRGPQVAQTEPTFRSIENLVENAEPINLSPSIVDDEMNLNNCILATDL